jgi:hypothetical protein
MSARPRPGAALALALLASLVFGAGAGLAALSSSTLIGARRTIEAIPYATKLCVGDATKVAAVVYMLEDWRYDPSGRIEPGGRSTGQPETIIPTVGDATVLSVKPDSITQGIRIWGRRPKLFTVTALKEATTTLTFADKQGTVRTAPITIDVQPCHYEVEISSKWVFTMGFRVTMTQTVDRMRLDGDPVVGQYDARPEAYNHGTAPPIGGCTVTYEVPRSFVVIEATEDVQRRGRLRFEITYLPVQSVKPEVCHVTNDNYQGTGDGQIAPLRFSINVAGASATKTISRHALSTSRGSVNGTTTITVYRVTN